VTSPGGALYQGSDERPGALFPGVLGFRQSLAFGGSRAAPAPGDLPWDHFPNLPCDFCASGARPRLRAPGRSRAHLLGVAELRRLAKPAVRAPGALRETTSRQGRLEGCGVAKGLGGVRHVFSAAPSKGENSVTTREATAPVYDCNCLDPQRPGSLWMDSLEYAKKPMPSMEN